MSKLTYLCRKRMSMIEMIHEQWHLTEYDVEALRIIQYKNFLKGWCNFSDLDLRRFFWCLDNEPQMLCNLYQMAIRKPKTMNAKFEHEWECNRRLKIMAAATRYGPQHERLTRSLERKRNKNEALD